MAKPENITALETKRRVMERVAYEVFGQGQTEAVEELAAPDFVDHDPMPGNTPDRDGFKRVVELFRGGFSDLEIELPHTIVDGDKVLGHIRLSGTHDGEFMGVPPTGKHVDAAAIVIARLGPDRRIAELWQRVGAMQLMQQIGVIPGWEEPPPVPPVPLVEGGRQTTPDENKAIVTRQAAVWNDGDERVADEIFHPQAVSPDAPQLPPGPDGCKVAARIFRDAFPDFRIVAEDVLAEDDLVACRFRQTGTHEGELFGIPPTGRSVDFGEIAICQVADAKIVASWFQTDMLTLMSQLGVGQQQTTTA